MTSCISSRSSLTYFFVTLMMILQISACSTEDLVSAVSPQVGSDTNTEFGADGSGTSANITLAWVAPAEREDNSPIALSEIAGYRIYYGTQPGQYPDSVTLNDGSASDYTFQNFTAGNHYFVLTTIDTEGRESSYSTAILFTI